ncbi:aminoglycoside phosphotransferase family protein [Micromonospora sp. NPDC049645]|uniref:aminoglycoside phosphotransferase family protein n=1 Tax=Micromonospora sp. NPDC049645 TaxID=3155508 RepID=UPI003438744A
MTKMHATALDIDNDLVSRLVAEQFPQWSALPLVAVPSPGTNNALFRLGPRLVVRLPLLERAIRQLDKDFSWLPRLAPHLPVAVPEPVAKGRPALGYPWSWGVYRWLDGRTAPATGLADSAAVPALAGFVTALHALDLPDGPPARRGVPLLAQDAGARDAIDQLTDTYDRATLTQLWDEALAAPGWDRPPTWLHGDLGPGNVLLRDGALTAVIDFGGLGVGDPACDAIPAWSLVPPTAREAFRRALRLDDATWSRGRGWALSISLMQLPYYWDSNPFLKANSIHVINEIIRERFGPKHVPPTLTDQV